MPPRLFDGPCWAGTTYRHNRHCLGPRAQGGPRASGGKGEKEGERKKGKRKKRRRERGRKRGRKGGRKRGRKKKEKEKEERKRRKEKEKETEERNEICFSLKKSALIATLFSLKTRPKPIRYVRDINN